MKSELHVNLKEYFWNSLKKITNNFSNLKVSYVDNGYVKCFWELSAIDNLRIDLSKSCFFSIRLFDITNNRNQNYATCIMKEIELNRFQSSSSFPIPINKGVYYFELGYRKKNGEWRKLAYQTLNLGYRIKKIIYIFNNDNWFNPKSSRKNSHHLGYNDMVSDVSLISAIGGSEKVIYNQNNIEQ